MDRPELSKLPPEVVAYIESLEAELQRYRKSAPPAESAAESELPALKANELPGTRCLVTLSGSGTAKRTPRHLYTRQRRGGMGIFDLDTSDDDPPAVLAECEEGQNLLLFTNMARAFRLSTNQLSSAEIRSRGQNIAQRFGMLDGEKIVAAIPDETRGGVALVSEWGFVRFLRHHVFGEYMKPGTVMFDARKYGSLVSACRTPGDSYLFIATRAGKAIRFSEKLVPPQGGQGMKVEAPDRVVAVTSVNNDSMVFLVDANGRGTLRQMASFTANKSAGGGGKIAIHSDELVTAFAVGEEEDVFLVSRLSKLIRFMAGEVPVKDAPVQGVNCMLLRADEVVAGIKA